MQQSMNQQEQCGNQQQFQQQVMVCPVQYVYEAPVILPQAQEDQTQQNQILINVKNPPPWIQNRTQNQIVYVQQLPNNYQAYMQPQMIQNPIYQQQMSYQVHPMLAQDNRQYIQIPNLNHYNMVQNPTAQVMNEETEKMPLLTQMLNQKANANNNKAPNNNNVRPNMTPTVNMIRPITQNQQVQTDNVSPNIKGRPRNVVPQIITINPMQQRQLTNQKQETLMNVRPTNLRNDLPQHIRTKIPSSISVKSIHRPILPRTFVRPFDVMPAPQNFYYNPIIMPAPNTEAKNIMTNTENQMKPNNFQEMPTRATVPMQYSIPVSTVSPFMNMTPVQNPGDTQKQTVNVNFKQQSNPNPVNMQRDNDKKPTKVTKTINNVENQTQTEEKLVRNTVFVQARGRLLNDKEIIQNQRLKRTVDDKLKEENSQKQDTSSDAKNSEEAIHISKKIKIEVTENKSEINDPAVNISASNLPMNIQTQQSRISNLLENTDNVQKLELNTLPPNKINKLPINLNVFKSEEPKPVKEDKDSDQTNSYKTSIDKENKNIEDIKGLNKISDKVNNNSALNEETNIDDVKKKEGKITVLTHVLEGYIIQESNVAFPIQKPTTEREIVQEQDTAKSQDKNKVAKRTKKEDSPNEKLESNGFVWRFLNKSIESEKEMEFAVNNKDDPFANVKKSTVESWTAEQLASHLEKYNWTETSAKLLDEEIDGESMLLVNKEQLVAIGVCEEHAEVIVAFAAS